MNPILEEEGPDPDSRHSRAYSPVAPKIGKNQQNNREANHQPASGGVYK